MNVPGDEGDEAEGDAEDTDADGDDGVRRRRRPPRWRSSRGVTS